MRVRYQWHWTVKMANIIKLVQTAQRERIPVAQFLKEWADATENDEETTSAVLILYGDVGSKFRVRVLRCNADLMQALECCKSR